MYRSFLLALTTAWWALVVLAQVSVADISLPSIFSDNMVLQRHSNAKIYGTAKPNQQLVVQFGERELSATADAEGSWSVTMPTGAAGGPFELIVTAKQGQPQVKLMNVMVGEVWLCAGQSNMRWPVANSLNAKREIERSIDSPNIRLFTVKESASRLPLKEFSETTRWKVCSPESVGDFSGAGYFFAREFQKKFPGVPVGLVMSAYGGTTCEAWTSRSGLEGVERFKSLLEHWDGREDENQNRPAALFNGMIAPLKHVKLRGVLWYQGEANHRRGEQYSKLLPNMVKDWRNYFADPELPFLFVQLAPYRYANSAPESLPELWDAQLKTLRTIKGAGMVVTTDIGDLDDIHPRNKQEVGRRLALLALGKVYANELPKDQADLVVSGPIYRSMAVEGNKIRLFFDYATGLRARRTDQPFSYFQVAGPDRQFFQATAEIVDDHVELICEQVDQPVAVRFGWTDTAEPNLINAAGLPASPFRTDNFPLLSEGKDF